MRTKQIPNDLEYVKLFFEPKNGSEEPSLASICQLTRQKFKASQEDMAKKLQISVNTYKSWEQGKRDLNSTVLFNLFIMYLQALEVKEAEDQLSESNISTFLKKLDDSKKTKPQVKHPQTSSNTISKSE